MSEKSTQRGTPAKIFSARRPPDLEQERYEARQRMLTDGVDFNSMSSKDRKLLQENYVKEDRARRGELAFYQDRGVYEPSPRQRAKWAREDEEMAAGARGRADKELERQGVTPGADTFWDDSVSMLRRDKAQTRAVPTDDGGEMRQVATKYGTVTLPASAQMVADSKAYREKEAARAAKIADMRVKGRNRALEVEADQLAARLREKGLPDEPRKEDGSFDADKARGMLSQKTFDDWDYDKRLARNAVRLERDARAELRDLRSATRSRFGATGRRDGRAPNQEELARMRELENMIETGEQERDGLRPGFWRSVAEDEDRNRIAGVEKSRVLADSQRKQADAVRKKADSVGRPLTDEELKSIGYPAWDDEVAWQELIKVNRSAAEVYRMRPVNVSRAGRAMSKALSAYT